MREQASGGNRADTNQVDETGTGTGTGPNTKTQKTRECDTRTGSKMTRVTCNMHRNRNLKTTRQTDANTTQSRNATIRTKARNINYILEH